jgi:hypothetical protein
MKNNVMAICLVVMASILPAPVRALDGKEIPPMEQFIGEVVNGEPDELRGVYASSVMAYEILPQPAGYPAFVTSEEDAITRFQIAEEYETIGLLAHNYLAGSDFFLLEDGQIIHLIYGDGRIEPFIVRHSLRYQALSPNSVTSDFIDLETGEYLTSAQLFLNVYNRPGDVVLQTCILAEGDPSWGRLFIVAEPYEASEPRSMPGYLSFQ